MIVAEWEAVCRAMMSGVLGNAWATTRRRRSTGALSETDTATVSYLLRSPMPRAALATTRALPWAALLASCRALLLLGGHCLRLPGWRRSASA